jgi:hypothetical protein
VVTNNLPWLIHGKHRHELEQFHGVKDNFRLSSGAVTG